VNHALLFGLPVLGVIVLIALIYRNAGNRPAPYRLPQPWTHEPVLWTATEESIPVRHHGGDHHGGDHHGGDHHGGDYVAGDHVVGGGASGRW
jgi:hypothetical protein